VLQIADIYPCIKRPPAKVMPKQMGCDPLSLIRRVVEMLDLQAATTETRAAGHTGRRETGSVPRGRIEPNIIESYRTIIASEIAFFKPPNFQSRARGRSPAQAHRQNIPPGSLVSFFDLRALLQDITTPRIQHNKIKTKV